MNKTKVPALKENPDEKPIFQLNGLDISEFKSKPLDANITIKKEITNIPVKVPNSQQFFRTHPEIEYNVDCIRWKEEQGKFYLLHPQIVPVLQEQATKVLLHLGMFLSSRNIFLFPVQLPKPDGKWHVAHEAQAEAVDKAKEHWVRMEYQRDTSGYNIHLAEGNLDEPEWPDKTIEEIISIAFKNQTIIDENHSIVKQLRGL